MRVYFDASVIIAAFLSATGGSSLLLTYVKKQVIYGITSQTVVDEISESGKYEKFHTTKEEIEQFIGNSGLLIIEHIATTEEAPFRGKIDTQDIHIIAGALLTQCDYVVTLDKKHLLRSELRHAFLPLRIVSPKELLEEIIEKKE